MQLQLRRAVEMKDPARIISREIALKKLYLEAHGTQFELHRLPLLLSPQEWAAAKFLSSSSAKVALAEGMLYHPSGGGIHKPF